MNDQLIEAALRAGPPDEPVSRRPLVLPPLPVSALRVTAGRAERANRPAARSAGKMAISGVVVLLALAASSLLLSSTGRGPGASAPSGQGPTIGGSGAVVAGPSPSSGASSTTRLGDRFALQGGVTLQAPDGWSVLLPGLPIPGGGALAVMANFDLASRCADRASLQVCAASLRLAPGEMLATVSIDETAMRVEDVVAPGSTAERIDRMPAALQVVEEPAGTQITGVAVPPGCDAHRAWWIARPGHPSGWLDVEACSAEADRGVFRSAVDAVARSIEFP